MAIFYTHLSTWSRPLTIMKGVRTRWGEGGGPPLYKLYRYVPSQSVGFIGLFGRKHFAHFCLKSGMILEETTGAYMYEPIYHFSSK